MQRAKASCWSPGGSSFAFGGRAFCLGPPCFFCILHAIVLKSKRVLGEGVMLQSVATVVFGVLVLRLVALLLFAWGQFRQSRRQRGHMRRSGVLQESGAKGGDLGGSPAAGGRSARADLGLEPRVAPSAVWPGVTVLVPAYNEEAVIGWTLHHLLCSDYPAFEVLVVDDGSQDGTVARVQELCARWPQLRLLQQPRNQGKAEALNAGIAHATFDLIVTVDADTRLAPDALRAFVGALQEDDVSAVTGVLLVGNLHNPLLVCQEVEYTAGIHVERRAQSFLSCITTLPGAASAFRKQALRDVGGFCADTMAEDSDLTLTLLRHGHRLAFEDRAVAWTEAPATPADFCRQRFRWLYGSIQCAWKHRRTWSQAPSAGLRWFGFPNFLFSTLSIFVFLPVYLTAVVRLLWAPSLEGVLLFASVFVLDLLLTFVAYALEGRWPPLWTCLLQKHLYMFLMLPVVLRVLSVALQRHKAPLSWGQLRRVGTWMRPEEKI